MGKCVTGVTGWRAAAAAAAVVMVMTASACSGGDEGDDEKKPSSESSSKQGDGDEQDDSSGDGDQVLGEAKGGDDITLTIRSAEREEGGFITVSGDVTNQGSDVWAAPGWQGDENELAKNGASMAGAKLVDKQGKKRYYILRDTSGRCLCTQFSKTGVDTGQTKSWYAQFPAPPKSTKSVDFQIADMPSVSIEISG